jgi:hypothetical protein
MIAWRSHLPFALLMLAAAPLTLRFVWHPGLSSIGDDSVAYLTLAQWLAGTASPFVREWVTFHSNFPPLFPLLLAATGGAHDLLVAHVVTGVLAILALPLFYRFAASQLGSERAAAAVVLLFLLTPSAWTSPLAILSEPLFMVITLAALHFHARRAAAPDAPLRDGVILGVLLALAFLTRTAAIALVAAYGVHAAIAAVLARGRPRWPLSVPLLPLAACAALWLVLRPPFEGENYGLGMRVVLDLLRHDPARLVFVGARGLASGWIASFAIQPDVHLVTRVLLVAAGMLAVGGAILRARRNALDGWYALASLAMLFLWFQRVDTTRRLLYPLLPVLFVHAAIFVRYLVGHMRPGMAARAMPVLVAAAVAIACVPAVVMVHSRSLERAPVIPGYPHSYAGITEFYTALSEQGSRVLAAREVAVLVGLEALATDTPPDASILWMRPDYVALLGNRRGVPWYYPAGLRGLAQALQRSGAQYLIVSTLYKADLKAMQDEPFEALDAVAPFAKPVSFVRNAAQGGNEFALLRVDPAGLAAFLAR